jgi:hypothetical protein
MQVMTRVDMQHEEFTWQSSQQHSTSPHPFPWSTGVSAIYTTRVTIMTEIMKFED